MAPQVWIAIVLMSIMFFVKFVLITFSNWYQTTQFTYGWVGDELRLLAATIALNVFAIYGLQCTIKGGCTVYSWAIAVILVLLMAENIYAEVVNFTQWKALALDCTRLGGSVVFPDTPHPTLRNICIMPNRK
jgi:hypothetical protein